MHTALVLTLLAADLTPSARLVERLDAIEQQRAAIDERRSTAQVIRFGAAAGYSGAVLALIWAGIEANRDVGRAISPITRVEVEPRTVDPVVPWMTSALCLGVAVMMHIGVTTFTSSLDDEQEALDAEARQLAARLTKERTRQWADLDGPPAAPAPP